MSLHAWPRNCQSQPKIISESGSPVILLFSKHVHHFSKHSGYFTRRSFFIALSFNGAAQSKSDYVNVSTSLYTKTFLMAYLCEGQCLQSP
jgi:hypothetical protein